MSTRREFTAEERREYAERCRAVEESYAQTAVKMGRKHYRAHCPFCVSSKTGRPDYSLDIAAATGRWSCFRCDVYGKLREPPDPGAIEHERVELKTDFPLPPDFIEIGREPGYSAMCTEEGRMYARKRGISPILAFTHGIGVCLKGRCAQRLVIPLHDATGLRRGWVGRSLPSGNPSQPYKYPRADEGFSREDFIFNAEALNEKTDAPLIVVEGVLDAIAFLPFAVPTLGKPGDAHRQALLNVDRPIALVPDGDAWREARALSMWLRYHGKTAGFVRLPPRTDPDECPDLVYEDILGCFAA